MAGLPRPKAAVRVKRVQWQLPAQSRPSVLCYAFAITDLCLKELPLLVSLFSIVCSVAQTCILHLLHLHLRYFSSCPIR